MEYALHLLRRNQAFHVMVVISKLAGYINETRRFRIYYAWGFDRFFCVYSGDFAPLLGVLMKNNVTMSVIASATYLQDQSVVESNRFLWSYEITITNESDQIVQLLSRYWRIVDMMGHVEEVRGPGVVGLQPIIKPGKTFAYTSFCQLMTPHGEMEGNYTLQTLDEVSFIIPIPKFILSSSESIIATFRSRLH